MLRVVILSVLSIVSLLASQMEPRTLISPFTGKPFSVIDIPVNSGSHRVLGVDGASDMGTDADGCRHSSGVSEYEHYVAMDPYSYFAALGVEYGKDGRFTNRLSAEFKDWVVSPDGFHSEWVIDKDKFYDRGRRQAKARGQGVPPIGDWVIPQKMIPLEKKYRIALFCYKRRGATDAFLGKLALTGAWALRARINKPLMDTRLRPGVDEVNAKISRYVKDGAVFELQTFYDAYRQMFRSSSLTDEGYFICGNAYLGLALRVGDIQEVMDILDAMHERFDEKEDMHVFFRGLIRDRRNTIKTDYLGFLDTSIKHFTTAIANEEFPRSKLPEVVLVMAENYRRTGNLVRSYDWFLTLADMEESDPRLRAQIRDAGRAPTMDAPYAVVLGWSADEALQSLTEAGVVHPGKISGPDSRLLNAIVNEGLGTIEYKNPAWQPRVTGNQREVTQILHDVGLGVLDYTQRSGEWPAMLGELWQSGVLPDRNRYNRFHCTVTGKPFLYTPIGGELGRLPKNTVILSTSAPIPTNQGPRYGAFLADLAVVWTAQPLKPGELHQP